MSVPLNNAKLSNFYSRTISSLFLFPPVCFAVYYGGFLYFSLLFITIVFAGYEWSDITGKWSFGLDSMVLITFVVLSMTCFYMNYKVLGLIFIAIGSYLSYLAVIIRKRSEATPIIPAYLNRPSWFFWGSIYLSVSFSAMSYLVNVDGTGMTILWVFMATIFNDVFAYLFGSILKGKKIAVKISQGKTWSGFFAASIFTTILSYTFAVYVGSNNELFIIVIGFFIAFFAHLGDFLESYMKRYIGIKDSSNLIPGHGGILDRIDAIVMVSVYISILSIIIGKSPLYM